MSMNDDTDKSREIAIQEARDKAKKSCAELSRHILNLLPTVEEALNRMSVQLEDLKLEASIELFQDFGNAVQSIDNSLSAVLFENQDIDKITPYMSSVFESINSLIVKYEAKNIMQIKACLSAELLPNFKALRQELETVLHKAFPLA